MRVVTGDAVGILKVTDIQAKTVTTLLKPTVPSRLMEVTFIGNSKNSDSSLTANEILVGRRCGVIECVDVTRPSIPLFILASIWGEPIFGQLLGKDRLILVTQRGAIVLIDVAKLSSATNTFLDLSKDPFSDDVDPKVQFAEQETLRYNESAEQPSWVIDIKSLHTDEEPSDDEDNGEEEKKLASTLDRQKTTTAFVFTNVQGDLCVGVAGYRLPLTIWQIKDELVQWHKTSHMGRITCRDLAPKTIRAGYLGPICSHDAFYSVDQRGKCRFYIRPDSDEKHNAVDLERSCGPIFVFQSTTDNTCPHFFTLMTDNLREKPDQTTSQDDEEPQEASDDDDTKEDGADEPQAPVASSSGESDEEEYREPRVVEEEENSYALLHSVEDLLLQDSAQYKWTFAVGDVKGGIFVLEVNWEPQSDRYKKRMSQYRQEGHLEEYYDRTKIRRRFRVNVTYKIGQLIDTSPLEYGDRYRHHMIWSALQINVSDTFKGMTGALTDMVYSKGIVALAGLGRRLYIYERPTIRWNQTHKINLKNPVTAVATLAEGCDQPDD